jgi:flagellar hook-associated protein FlgK
MNPSALSGASATAIGLSGMRAAQQRLDTSAHNIANAQTPGVRRLRVEQSAVPLAGGVETQVTRENEVQTGELDHLAEDLVAQRMSLYSFAANLKTVQTEDRMLGSLLDRRA